MPPMDWFIASHRAKGTAVKIVRWVFNPPNHQGIRTEIVAEGGDFAALVGKVVDELGVFAIFSSKDFLQFEDRACGRSALVL